jgi:hypothetical protein
MRDAHFCFRHNPETLKEQLEASTRGGNHNRVLHLNLKPVSLRTPAAVLEVIEETVNLVRSGQMPTNAANTIGILSQYSMKVIGAVDRATEEAKTLDEKEDERLAEMSHEQKLKYYEDAAGFWQDMAKYEQQNMDFERMRQAQTVAEA